MADFETIIHSIYKDQGRAWLEALPDLTQQCEIEFNLKDLKPVQNLSYNYVLTGLQAGRPIVLKLGLDHEGLAREAAALKVFQGHGGVDVLGEAPGALLLSRAVPGSSLKSYYPAQDQAGLKIACEVMQRLHQAPVPNTGFPQMSDWLKILDKDWDIPAPYLAEARKLRDRLLLTASSPVFLHGDLHHDNILQDGESWMVIDPKGVIGQPVHEVWALMRNPNPDLSLNEIKERLKTVTKELNLESRLEKKFLCWDQQK